MYLTGSGTSCLLTHHIPRFQLRLNFRLWLWCRQCIRMTESMNTLSSALLKTNREGSPSCCTLEGGWENMMWGLESHFPLWRKVWWLQWTHRTGEQMHRVVCGWEKGLHWEHGWRRWETWWLADLKNPAESDSWWGSPHWWSPLHTVPPLALPLQEAHWVSHLQPQTHHSHHSAED